jgi:two-component system nitrate/nitrite response regulator NarL
LLLIDDNRLLTEAVAGCLCGSADVWVAALCTTDDPNLAEVTTRVRPDVIALDVEPLGAAVGDTTAQLAAAAPTACIVVLTGSRDPLLAVAAARAGVMAWVPKQAHLADFVATVRAVGRGDAVFPPDLLGVVLRELSADARRAHVDAPPSDPVPPHPPDRHGSGPPADRAHHVH